MQANLFLEELPFLPFEECTFFSSGTSAILYLLEQLSTSCSKIAFTDNTCFQVILPPLWLNYDITLMDVNNSNLQLDIENVESIIKDVDILLWVHQYGLITDLKRIRFLCDLHNTILIEDACQSFPSRTFHPSIGQNCHFLILSFGAGKLLSSFIGGGLLFSKYLNLASYKSNLSDFAFFSSSTISSEIDFNSIYNSCYFSDSRLFTSTTRAFLRSINPILYTVPPSLRQFRASLDLVVRHEFLLEEKLHLFENIFHGDFFVNTFLLPYPSNCIPWRLTFLLPINVNKLFFYLLNSNFPVSSWYPSLTYCVDCLENAVEAVPRSLKASFRILNYDIKSPHHSLSTFDAFSNQIEDYLANNC